MNVDSAVTKINFQILLSNRKILAFTLAETLGSKKRELHRMEIVDIFSTVPQSFTERRYCKNLAIIDSNMAIK